MGRAVTQPIDFIKIRLQCDTQKYHTSSSNLSRSTDIIKTIWKNEFRLRAFFKGHLTGQLLYLGWSIEYPLFNYINKNYFIGKSAAARLKSGLATGFICVLLLNPLDTLRTNLVNTKNTKKLWRDIPEILKRIKFVGLYKGLVPALLMYSPATAGLYTIYYMMQEKSGKANKTGFTSGFVAGTVIKMMIHPLDVVKKRMQINDDKIMMRTVVKDIYFNEGLRAFYKGGAVSIFKSGLGNAVRFMVLEFILKYQFK